MRTDVPVIGSIRLAAGLSISRCIAPRNTRSTRTRRVDAGSQDHSPIDLSPIVLIRSRPLRYCVSASRWSPSLAATFPRIRIASRRSSSDSLDFSNSSVTFALSNVPSCRPEIRCRSDTSIASRRSFFPSGDSISARRTYAATGSRECRSSLASSIVVDSEG